MIVIQESTKARITLDTSKNLGHGGEGAIFPVVNQCDIVAKLYYNQQKGSRDKLLQMIQSPPADPTTQQGHISICWPIDLIGEEAGSSFGYLMPKALDSREVSNLYTASSRIQHFSQFNYQYLVRSSLNLARVINAIHRSGYVIGDINESNILVNQTAHIAIVDTDSFQVRTPTQTYHCNVKKDEFLPPELIGVALNKVDREQYHDNFSMAVILFHLLMEGTHPFKGAYNGAGNPPTLKEKIKEGYFPYSVTRSGPIKPGQFAPPFSILNKELQELFLRAFDDGHLYPYARPTPQEWVKALRKAEKELIVCNANSQHYYPNHLSACPWCERRRLLKGVDPFPEKQPSSPSTQSNTKSNAPRPKSPSPPPRPSSAPILRKTTARNLWIWSGLVCALLALLPVPRLAAGLAAIICNWVGRSGSKPISATERRLSWSAIILSIVLITITAQPHISTYINKPRLPEKKDVASFPPKPVVGPQPTPKITNIHPTLSPTATVKTSPTPSAAVTPQPAPIQVTVEAQLVYTFDGKTEHPFPTNTNAQLRTFHIDKKTRQERVDLRVPSSVYGDGYVRFESVPCKSAFKVTLDRINIPEGPAKLLKFTRPVGYPKDTDLLKCESLTRVGKYVMHLTLRSVPIPPPTPTPAMPEPPPSPPNAVSPEPAVTPTPLPKVSGGVYQGKAIKKVQPTFPQFARPARASGPVIVQVTISEDGRVVEAKAISGHLLLRQSAEQAAKQWLFEPTLLSGKPISVKGELTFNFALPN